jgi:hypothetical protein
MRRALLDGVVNGDDIRRTHDVCGSCNTKKREHYRALADGWQRWRKGKDLIVNLRGEDWCQQGLVVRVAPPIIVRSKNHRDLVWLYYKEPELTSDAARIANRIIQLSIPSEIGRPAVRCSPCQASSNGFTLAQGFRRAVERGSLGFFEPVRSAQPFCIGEARPIG